MLSISEAQFRSRFSYDVFSCKTHFAESPSYEDWRREESFEWIGGART